jgi:UDP-N-acetylmuramate dehydrogenase
MNANFHRTNVDVTHLFTMKLPSHADNLFSVTTREELQDALVWCLDNGCEPIIVGGGSNSLPHAHIPALIIMKLDAITWDQRDTNSVLVTAGAGVVWDQLVLDACTKGWYDLAPLSAIPGSVGAAPVQNIGAYGREVSECIESVTMIEVATHTIQKVSAQDCGFGYRDSKWKHAWKGTHIILDVTLRLSQRDVVIPNYPGIQDALQAENIDNPSPLDIRNIITKIRWSKLPKPESNPNCGSYFHNVCVGQSEFEKLQQTYPTMPYFAQGNEYKIPTGWLLDTAGCKGFSQGNFATSSTNALVVIHHGGGTLDELLEFEQILREKVQNTFGLIINREPLIL